MNLIELISTLMILVVCVISALGWHNPVLVQRYAFNVNAVIHNKQYYRLVTSAFFHADVTHLFFNMFTLYFFSRVVMMVYGTWLFLSLYLLSVVVGNAFSLWLYQKRPSYSAIGASGGVSGILFATVALMPLEKIYFFVLPITSWIFATLYFAYSVTMMLKQYRSDNIGHAAHLGGAVCGMIFVMVFTPMGYWMQNILYIGIMLLPLLYLAYEILINKKIR